MISQITGKLISKELDRLEVMTSGGVGYDLQIPLSVYEAVGKVGEDVKLYTALVVKEDSWQLFGFASVFERKVFQKLLTANGVGPALAIGLLSTLSAARVVRALSEKDIPTLQSVPRVGRKKAERLILDLADKMDGIGVESGSGPRPGGGTAGASEDAIRALVSLGYSNADAEKAVRAALDGGSGAKTGVMSAPELIRAALGRIK